MNKNTAESLARSSLRAIPYPYRAALAICSDLDETPNKEVYWESTRYLNTEAQTAMGPGLGLEVGNTIYFDMPQDQFAYWNTDDSGRAMIQTLLHSGHIDCLHSFGDLATSRDHAARALDELVHHNCHPVVWIDHGVAQSNFGSDIMCGSGDIPGSPVYHADLTCSFGVHYVWRGRVTSVIGQAVKRSLRGILHLRHLRESSKTIAKEFLKGVIARFGQTRYAMHASNDVLYPTHLRSGQAVYEFLRANPHWGGVSRGETAQGMAEVLTEALLVRLVERQGVCIIYTHLGKVRRQKEPFESDTRKQLVLLAQFFRSGKILVTTTRRLLDYCLMRRNVTIATTSEQEGTCIRIDTTKLRSKNLDGLSLYVQDPHRARIFVDGREILSFQKNGPDHTGKPSVSFPWPRLEFPTL